MGCDIPGTGSFTARDSVSGQLRTPITLNRYTYANGDPLEHIDPDGHSALSALGSWIGEKAVQASSRVSSSATAASTATANAVRSTAATQQRRAASIAAAGRQKVDAAARWTGRTATNAAQSAAQPVRNCWRSDTCRTVVTATAVVGLAVACTACVGSMLVGASIGGGIGAATCKGDAGCVLRSAMVGALAGGGGLGLGSAGSIGLRGAMQGGLMASVGSQVLDGRLSATRTLRDVAIAGAAFGAGRAVGAAVGRAANSAVGQRAASALRAVRPVALAPQVPARFGPGAAHVDDPAFSSRILNLGGEGEVPGAINLNTLDAPLRSVETIRAGGQLVRGNMAQMPFADEAFSEVLGNKTPFMHGPWAESVATESYRVLQPGGSVRIASSNLGGQGWLEYLERAGFSNVQMSAGYATGVRP